MGELADSNRVRLSYVKEVTFGTEVVNPAMQILRLTSSDFAANKQTAVSDELRFDRQTGDLIEVAFDSGGTLNIEMSLGGTYDDLIEAAMANPFSAELPLTPTTLGIVAGTPAGGGTITDSVAGAHFTNAVLGQWILLAGFATNADNNNWFKVNGLTSVDEITVADPHGLLVTESGDADETARGKSITNGIIKSSLQVEQAFTDIEAYQLFSGQRVGTWAMNVESGAILTGSFGFQGTSVDTDDVGTDGTPGDDPKWLGSGSYLPATTSSVLNATSNVGLIVKDGVQLSTAVQSLDVELDNALRNQQAIGNKFPIGIGYGRVTISGTVSAYFEDMSLYNDMLNHNSVSMEFSFIDAAGNSMHLEFPRVKFASSGPSAPGIDQDVIEDIEWQAIVSDDGTYMMRVDIAGK